eukprot:CAMPEP_0198206576 /NCGR_PEP_ID=MMETSP1445-20131203/10129_1 /TAXON_ID=36898 /ORGANISM="Pyramimonas sp., Strain CCMP2087" /LENGTH=32 /DNA_ID= /DNA_START= /DNA_END= /DNA_ORIENTATION=
MGYDTFMPLETQEEIMSEEAMYEMAGGVAVKP